MSEIKKIIAKAAYGQGAQAFSKGVNINTYERKRPTKILGCIITDAEILSCSYEGDIENGKAVKVSIKFDTHLWYGMGNDTKVSKASTKVSEIVKIHAKGAEKYSDEEVRAWIKKAPVCTKTSIIDGQEGAVVLAQVEYELGAEIIGLTSLNVRVIKSIDEIDEPEDVPAEFEDETDEFEDD